MLTNNAGSYGFTMAGFSRNVGGTIDIGKGGSGSAPVITTTSGQC